MSSVSPPEGFTHVFTAPYPELADLLKDVLQSNGFDVFESDNDSGGLFRTSWGSSIYVRAERATEAQAFLDDYINDVEYQTRSQEFERQRTGESGEMFPKATE